MRIVALAIDTAWSHPLQIETAFKTVITTRRSCETGLKGDNSKICAPASLRIRWSPQMTRRVNSRSWVTKARTVRLIWTQHLHSHCKIVAFQSSSNWTRNILFSSYPNFTRDMVFVSFLAGFKNISLVSLYWSTPIQEKGCFIGNWLLVAWSVPQHGSGLFSPYKVSSIFPAEIGSKAEVGLPSPLTGRKNPRHRPAAADHRKVRRWIMQAILILSPDAARFKEFLTRAYPHTVLDTINHQSISHIIEAAHENETKTRCA